jgi:hypothetical protein
MSGGKQMVIGGVEDDGGGVGEGVGVCDGEGLGLRRTGPVRGALLDVDGAGRGELPGPADVPWRTVERVG